MKITDQCGQNFLKQRQLYLVTSEGVAKQNLYVSPDWHIHKARRARVGSTGSMVDHSPQVEQGFGRHTRRVARAQRMTQNDSLKKCRQMIGLFVFQLLTFIITNHTSFAMSAKYAKIAGRLPTNLSLRKRLSLDLTHSGFELVQQIGGGGFSS